jgi:hypothetical protein
MRALLLLLTGSLRLAACGGELTPTDGGPFDLLDAEMAPDGSTESGSVAGYCIYKTCGGLSLCGVGKTCTVGDGCNSCTCTAVSVGVASSTCTTTACPCP